MNFSLPPPGPHGGDGAAMAAALGLGRDDVLDLSMSLNPVAPDVGRVISKYLEEIRRYPDPGAATIALADAMDVDLGRLLLTNGGAEAIALVAAELGGRAASPEFSLLPGHDSDKHELPLWRSNPNNPSGLLAAPTHEADVWDEAFFPLATGRWTRGDTGSVVVGSLTKLFACPGLRIGYVLADPDVIERCQRRQAAWSVNSLACAVLPELLDKIDLSAVTRTIAELRKDLREVLLTHGLDSHDSDANWVLVEKPGLRERLAPQRVVVRDCASFGMPATTRIAVPDSEGLEKLDKALAHSSIP